MSRPKERKQRNCLNCRIMVKGRYCHRCGQENIEPQESVWELVTHFFKDITHFDGKFFSTVKYLFKKPGFLPMEYKIGRRASYVNPIRMYIFTSAFFFLIFFSLFQADKKLDIVTIDVEGKTYKQIESMDSLAFDAFTKNINKTAGKAPIAMTREEFKVYFDSVSRNSDIRFINIGYKSKAQYDSLLAAGKKDSWFTRALIYKQIELREKYNNRGGTKQALKDLSYILIHSLPQLFFLLLPIFAIILKLLYIRRKEYYLVSHGIFSIYYYIFCFLAMLLFFGLNKINSYLDWGFIIFLQVLISFGIFFYLYKAMRNFYRQRRAKTVFKFILLNFFLFISILFLFIFFIVYSLFKL